MHRKFLVLFIILAATTILQGVDEYNSNTFITTESLFEDKINQALSLELEERYDDALTVYINVLNRLESTDNEENETIQVFYRSNLYKDMYEKRIILGRYLPVKDFVLTKIAELPKDVRKRYEILVSGKAKILFQEAIAKNDAQVAYSVAENYYLADEGANYLFYASKLAFESGEFGLCSYFLEKMRDFWTKEFGDNSLCIIYLASSYVGAGDLYKFNKFRTSAISEYKGLSININNKVYNDITQLLTVDELKKLILNNLKANDTILKWGSDSTLGNLQFDFDKFTGNNIMVSTPNGNDEYSDSYGGRGIIIRRYGRYSDDDSIKDLIPGFSDNKIVLANKGKIKTVEFTETSSKSTSNTVKFPDSIYYPENTFYPETMQMDRVVVSGRYAYGIFEKSVKSNDNYYRYRYYGNSYSESVRILACVDLEDENKVVWWVPGQAEELDIEKFNKLPLEFLLNVGLDNSIILKNNKIYAAGILPGDEDKKIYIMCYDATPDPKFGGRLLWKTKLATISTPSYYYSETNNSISPFVLKYNSGFLYILTNTGLLTCLDTSSGNIKYITRYMRPKSVSNPNTSRSFFRYEQKKLQGLHWRYNPIIIHKGFLYFTPLDSLKLYVIKAQTGELVREYPFGLESADDYVYLLGVSNDILHIQGKKRCYGLNLKIDNDPTSQSAQNYELYAYQTVPFNVFGSQEKTTGRGVLGKDFIYIPTRRGIIKINAKNGIRENELLHWKVESNMIVLGDLYLYKTFNTKYLVSISYEQMLLMKVE